jgi:CSLREA domain-containing protein
MHPSSSREFSVVIKKPTTGLPRRRRIHSLRAAVLETLETRLLLSGNTYTVTSTADGAGMVTSEGGGAYDATTLRAAVTAANANGGGTISFDPSLTTSAPVTLTTSGDSTAGPSDLGIDSNITIIGPTGSNGITIANSGDQRLFYISPAGSLTLQNLTLSGGDAVGGSSAGGGGAAGMGGAIFNVGTLDLVQSTIENNTAQGGNSTTRSGNDNGGGGLGGNAPTNSTGGGPNGGAEEQSGGFGGGGGVGLVEQANGGFGAGGGYTYDGNAGNGGFGGGGGGNEGNGVAGTGGFGGGNGLYGTPGTGGGGAGMGGAIFNYGGTVTLTDSTLADNSALGGTGANNGQGLGGALFNLNGSITSDDSTLAYNTAANGGGAIYNHGDNPSDVGSQSGGPALPSSTAAVTLNNSILADSAASVSDFFTETSNGGTQTTAGTNNLIQTSPSNFTPTAGAPATLTGDPGLVGTTPSANGGPTDTFAISSTSPAFNVGSNAAIPASTPYDQRGVGYTRIVGGTVDLGAYEVQAATPTITTTAQPASAVVGGSIADTATVSGGDNPTGTVTFNLYNNDTATGPALFADTENLSGTASINADNGATEAANTVTITTTPALGIETGDSVTITGVGVAGYNGTFTVTGVSSSSFTYTDGTSGLEASGGGTASFGSSTVNSASYFPTASGTDYWVDTYNGDTNNASASTTDAGEPVTITPGSLVVTSTADNTTAAGTTLRDAINYANDIGGGTITLQTNATYDFTTVDNNWYGPNALPPIQSNITINGNGATLERDSSLPETTAGAVRFFYVSGGIATELPLGTLTLQNLTLTNGLAKGGDSTAGGGGLGAGGAIFNQGNLTLSGVTLTGNTALGGSSGVDLAEGSLGGGGIGQDAQTDGSGGGFGGSFPDGIYGGAGDSSGGGGFDAPAAGYTGGGFSGLGGFRPQGTGGDGGSNEGGTDTGGDFGFGGVDGAGGVGGGGAPDSDGGFGGGGGGIRGGPGDGNTTAGGFGGGGGGPTGTSGAPGPGGFGGGNASPYIGGGGAGMGGAVFSMFGSLTVINSTLTANTAQGGNATGSGGGDAGSGYGGAIFNLDGAASITFSTLAANTVTAGTGTVSGSADGGALYNLAYGSNYDTGKAVTAAATIGDSILAGTVGGTHDLVNQEVDGDYPTGPNADQNTGNTASITTSAPNIVVTYNNIPGGPMGTATLSTTGFVSGVTNANLGLAASLASNAGPTQTLALTAPGKAIGAGAPANYPGTTTPITTDQRGVARASKPDLGAFELTPAKATTMFSGLAAPTIILNTLAVTLGGTISGSTSTPPTGSVTITVTYASGPRTGKTALTTTAKIGSNGKFSSTILSVFGSVGSYSIQYSYAGDANNAANSANTTGAVTYGIKASNVPKTTHGGTIPVKLSLIDLFGINFSSSSTAVTATGIAKASTPNTLSTLPAGNATAFTYSQGTYTLNLRTTGLAAGTYILYFTAAGDPLTHSVQFVLS